MAKQTINIGASPNDGTGTPLRTAFDYTNQNFTELYTATGPSGNNIVVPGNATITGDLTVDTNVLKVDTNLNRVGVLNASPGVAFHIGTTGGTNRFAINTAFTSGGDIQLRRGAFIGFSNAADSGNSEYLFANGGALDFGINGSTAMTLNATGLGVGKTPLARLDVASTRAASVIGGIIGTTGTGVVADECQFLIKNVNTASGQNNGAGIGGLLEASASNKSSLLFYVDNGTAVTNVGRFDSNGNLGIGVAPSALAGFGTTLRQKGVGAAGGIFTENNTGASWFGIYSGTSTSDAAAVTFTDGGSLRFAKTTAVGVTGFTELLRLKNGGQLRFVPLASDPAGAEAGDVYYNSTSNRLKYYNGTAWTLI